MSSMARFNPIGVLRLAALVGVLASGSACGLFDEGPPPIGSEVPLTEPWAAMGLPVAGGRVTMSEPESLSVRFDGEAPEPVLEAFRGALESGGWALEADTSVPGVVNQTWRKDNTTLAVSGLAREGEIKVSVSILPF